MIRLPFPAESPYPRGLTLWEPAGKTRGIVLISHGMAEHIARYDELGKALANAGYLAAGYDHLGHGKNAPVKGFFAEKSGWDRAVSDLDDVMRFLSARASGVPRILFGHSMGSFLAREVALSHPDSLDALVLSGTGWQGKALCVSGLIPASLICLLGGAKKPSGFLDRLAFSANNRPFRSEGGTAFDWLSRDKAEVRKYVDDPLCGFVFTAGGFRDLFTGLLRLTRLDRLNTLPRDLPVLLISGGECSVGRRGAGPETVAGQYRKAGLKNVTVKIYEGARHELFNEINRDQVRKDLISWLDDLLMPETEGIK